MEGVPRDLENGRLNPLSQRIILRPEKRRSSAEATGFIFDSSKLHTATSATGGFNGIAIRKVFLCLARSCRNDAAVRGDDLPRNGQSQSKPLGFVVVNNSKTFPAPAIPGPVSSTSNTIPFPL